METPSNPEQNQTPETVTRSFAKRYTEESIAMLAGISTGAVAGVLATLAVRALGGDLPPHLIAGPTVPAALAGYKAAKEAMRRPKGKA